MHVRLCVDCGEEYRPEIAVCADCGGRLEDRQDDGDRTVLPAAKRDEIGSRPDAEFTETVGHAKAATDLMEVADRLIEAGLEVRVRPAPEGGYRLLVTGPDGDRALAALGLLVDPKDHAADDAIRSCPACDTRLPAGSVECPECGLVAGDDPEGEPDPD